MPSDDELRRVAEDVRALARSLGRDIRAAVDRAREDVNGPGRGDSTADGSAFERPPSAGRRSAREDLTAAARAARNELRQAQLAVRQSARRRHPDANRGDGTDADEGRRSFRGPRPRRPTGAPPPRTDAGQWAAAPAPIPAPPLRHRHDGSTLLGLLAVVFGLAWLAAGTHVADVSTEAVIAIALMVLGAATVVTARTDWALSRRSWPVLGGAVLALGLLVSASPNVPVGFQHLEFGSRTFAPTTWADVPPGIHGGFGRTVVDLTRIHDPLPAPTTLAVDGAAGRMEVSVPANLRVVLDARVSAGQIDVNGVTTSGLRRIDTETLNPSATGPALTLHVQSGFGSVSIATVPQLTPPPVAPDPTAPTSTPTGALYLLPGAPIAPTARAAPRSAR